jgi:hypothetical protein
MPCWSLSSVRWNWNVTTNIDKLNGSPPLFSVFSVAQRVTRVNVVTVGHSHYHWSKWLLLFSWGVFGRIPSGGYHIGDPTKYFVRYLSPHYYPQRRGFSSFIHPLNSFSVPLHFWLESVVLPKETFGVNWSFRSFILWISFCLSPFVTIRNPLWWSPRGDPPPSIGFVLCSNLSAPTPLRVCVRCN